jgi:hypothetical protein
MSDQSYETDFEKASSQATVSAQEALLAIRSYISNLEAEQRGIEDELGDDWWLHDNTDNEHVHDWYRLADKLDWAKRREDHLVKVICILQEEI